MLRTCAVYNGTCVNPASPGAYDAPVHAVIGHGGQNDEKLSSPLPDWAAFAAEAFGLADLTAWNSTHLTLNIFQNQDENVLSTRVPHAKVKAGEAGVKLIDTVTIVRSRNKTL